jgi:hypothetical protein
MKQTLIKIATLLLAVLASARTAPASDLTVDFGYKPPQWRTAICPPDDPYKSLVSEKGSILYHFNQARRSEFGTEVFVVVDDKAVTTGQTLLSPRIPIVQTRREAGGLSIHEEVFAARVPGPSVFREGFSVERKDRLRFVRNWAVLPAGVSPELATAAVDDRKPVLYQIKTPPGASLVVALAVCEGVFDKPGQRIMDLSAEGANPRRVDTVADLGKNVPGAFWFEARDVNSDGLIDVQAAIAPESIDKFAILNGFWAFTSAVTRDDARLLAGNLDAAAALAYYVGRPDRDSRNDIILVRVTNAGDAPKIVEPKVVVRSAQNLELIEPGSIRVNFHETVIATQKTASMNKSKNEQGEEAVMALSPLTVPAGKTVSFAVAYCGGGRVDPRPITLAGAEKERAKTEAFWKTVRLPYDRVVVPDPNIQALIDSSIRNIWQAREINNGLPAFMVGATYYRFLFIVDGAFILEAANMVGAGKETRAGIAYMLTYQQEDGRFELLPRYHKENGIVLWTCVRHAMLTQDKEWLRSIWPRLEKAVGYIKHLRAESYKDASPLNDGLMPPGQPDGGINEYEQYEYTNVYWNLSGLKAVIQAARWLDKGDQAREWQAEFDDFYATFRKAAQRDGHYDIHGNWYLPILMAIEDRNMETLEEAEWHLPCKAQWAFCHGVYPGQLFAKDDPLVKGNLDMLATYVKEGMVTTTGWLTGGIWNYFASFYGHTLLWQGNGAGAAAALYAFANHASPLLAWLEEQGLKEQPIRENGDMPHNWASAEFIRLAVHLLALDRDRELHLFEGLPAQWTRPGMETKLDGIATPFGPLTCSLKVAADGASAVLKVKPLSDPSCDKLVVHLGRWASPDASATQVLDPRREHQIAIPIAPAAE